jgi:hypothetical protein
VRLGSARRREEESGGGFWGEGELFGDDVDEGLGGAGEAVHDDLVLDEEFGHGWALGGESGVVGGDCGEEVGDGFGIEFGLELICGDGGFSECGGGWDTGWEGEFEEAFVEAGEDGGVEAPDGETEFSELAGGLVVFDGGEEVGIAGAVEGAGDDDDGELVRVGGFEGVEVFVEFAAAFAGVVEVLDEDCGGVGVAEDGEVSGVEVGLAAWERDEARRVGGAGEGAGIGREGGDGGCWGGSRGWGGGGGSWGSRSWRWIWCWSGERWEGSGGELVAFWLGAEELAEDESGGGGGGGESWEG